jgi:predicted permease
MKLRVLYTSSVVLVAAFVCEVKCFAPPLLRASRGNRDPLSEGRFAANVPAFTATSAGAAIPIHPVHRNSPNRGGVSLSASALGVSALSGGFGVDAAVAVAAVSATAKLLSSIGIGGWAAKRPNLLDDAAVSSLSKLTYWVFQPLFLFCSVSTTMASACTGSSGLPLGVMAIAALVQVLLGSVIGKIVTSVGNFGEDERKDVTISLAFGNSGPLPLIFADALFASSPAVQSDVVACISFYLLVWSPLFWSVGRMMVGTYDENVGSADTQGIARIVAELKKLLSPPVVACLFGIVVGANPLLRMLFFNGIATPLFGACKTLGGAYVPAALLVLAGSLVGGNSKPAVTTATESNSTLETRSMPSKKALFSILFSRFVLSPLTALCLVGVLDSFNMLSTARSKAIVTFVLLMEGCMVRTVGSAILSYFIVSRSCLSIQYIHLLRGLTYSSFPISCHRVFLQPPAQNSVIMLQLSGLQQRAKTMAKMLTIIYSIAVIPVTILLSYCLKFSKILTY